MEDLRSGIEHLKQAKAHMSEANGIMSGHISKLKALEDENAELRAKLEAWIQSDDSYMKLPLDADGEPIRIGDVLYSSGNEFRVVSITVKADEACVGVHTDEGAFLPSVNPKYISRKKPEPADSWERIEEDAKLAPRDYLEKRGMNPEETERIASMMADIVRRAKALAKAGEVE